MKPKAPKMLVAQIAPPATPMCDPACQESEFDKHLSLMAADRLEYGMDLQGLCMTPTEDEERERCILRAREWGGKDAVAREEWDANNAAFGSATRVMGRLPR
jgi:hypothetical protein